ncbi:MAG: hypothetical protein U0800_00420 [Isosphaeraceae bacterium]
MTRFLRNLLLTGFAALAPALGAQAQYYYPGYGYGYGGWYGASTAPGDILRGEGFYYQGLGEYLVSEAVAARIHSERLGMQNEYARFIRWTVMHDATLRRQMENRRNVLARDAIETRKMTTPNRSDLYLGDSLNLLMGNLTAPGVDLPSFRLVEIRLPADLVLCLPLIRSATEPTVCLRDVDRAPLPPGFQAGVIEADPLRFSSFRRTLRDRDGVSLLDLVEFMRDFDLRFGKAEEPIQREAYSKLFNELARFRPASMNGPAPEANAMALRPIASR